MKKGKSEGRWAEWLLLAGSLILLLGSRFVFHACGPREDGGFMTCHWAERMVSAEAFVLTLQSLLVLVLKDTERKSAAALCMIPSALLTVLTPGVLISLCLMPDMRCRAVMRPSVAVIGAVLVILAALRGLLWRKTGRHGGDV